MKTLAAYIIPIIVLCSLYCANVAFASVNLSTNGTPQLHTDASINHAPVGEDLAFYSLGGFLRMIGGFFRLGVSVASSPSACPMGSTYVDGCPGAPVGGNVQHSNFFTGYANQNGQSYGTNRPPWNVAGVDYPVGIPSASITAGLKDPTSATLPTGCTYSSSAHSVTCSGAHGGLTIDGWDFGNAGGAGLCVRLVITGNVNGHIIIQNSNFANTTGNGAQCNVANGELVDLVTNSAATDVVVQDNVFDANAQNVTYAPMNPSLSIIMSNGQNVTIEYNAFLHSTARAIQVAAGGTVNESFNYAEGFTYTFGQALHGEFSEDSTFGGGTAALKNYSFNTILEGKDAVGHEATSLIYASSGAANSTWTTVNVNNNTLVSNNIGGSNPVSYLAETSYDTFTTLNWTQNYFDPNGAFGCFYPHANPPTSGAPVIGTENFSGNIDMFDGSTVSTTSPACAGHN
jgi:hypothetical protein